jgi:Protein of unknown function (DUF2795)
LEFPKDKSELVSIAGKSKGNTQYPKALMDAIHKISDRKYVSVEDLYREIEKNNRRLCQKGDYAAKLF